MREKDIMKAIMGLNNDAEIGYDGNNIWYTKSERYSGFIDKLTEIILFPQLNLAEIKQHNSYMVR